MPLKLFGGGDGGGGGSSGGGRREGGSGDKLEKVVAKVARAMLPPGMKRDKPQAERPYFDPEEYISEKRQWSRRYMAAAASGAGGSSRAAAVEADRLFEHFAVVGLPPTTNIRAVASDIKTYQRLRGEGGGGGATAGGLRVTPDTPREERQRQYGVKGPALAGEVLYTFPPPSMPADLRDSLAAFAFPHGVRPELLERTPSMSALNEIIYSQPYQTHDDHSFVFLMKVADPGSATPRTLYGVCCYVRELVHRPPSMAREAFPGCTAPLSRYLVVAPRCYCLLTYHPFFALHFRVLQTILGLERLERMTGFAAELAALEAGGGPRSSKPGSSSLLTGSAGGPPSSASSRSTGREVEQAIPPAAAGAAASAAAARAAGTGRPGGEEDDASEASSRRWTEGSEEPAAAAQQASDAAALLAQLGLGEAQQQQQQQKQQQQQQQQQHQEQQQRRPSRLAQVSPHCPPSQPAGGEATGQAQVAAEALPAGVATPPEHMVPGSRAAASGVAPTPFFTPSGPSGAPGSPAARGAANPPGLLAAGESGGGGAVCRALESSLELARAAGDSSKASGSSATGQAPDSVEGGQGGEDGGAEQLTAALPDGGSQPRLGSAGSPGGSRPGSRQRWSSIDDDASSEAGSFMTASSSTALLGLQPDGSPALAPAAARASPHLRSISGTSLGGFAGGSPLPASAAGLAPQQQGQQEQLLQQEAEGGEEGRPAGVPSGLEQPLLVLDGEEAPAASGEAQGQQARQQQAQEVPQPPPLPLLQLDDLTPAAADPSPTQQQQIQQHDLPPLLDLGEADGSRPRGVSQQDAQQQATQEQQQQQPEQQQRLLGGALGVHIVTRSISSSELAARADADTPARDDLLTAAPAGGRSGRHAPPHPPAGAQAQAQQQGHESRQRGEEGEEGSWRQVVRVTATHLDMSRPLRSADLLAVYRASVVPRPGQVFEFQPDPGLQTIAFERPDLAEAAADLGLRPDAAALPDIDAAANLGGWAVAALCRALSLDNILTFLAAALLERQVVVFCPNAGLLSGVVLSLVPLLLPFHWQCLLLPVLPASEGRLELMEAPVPFVLGVLYKTPEVRSKCGGLVRVNVYKDRVKNVGGLPALPQQAALAEALAGTYAELRKIGLTRAAATRPVHLISDAQQVLARCFLATLQKWLRGLVADLRAYTITDVSASLERTSVLLKDSFVDSFPPRDRPFMRALVETQLFSVYCDSVL